MLAFLLCTGRVEYLQGLLYLLPGPFIGKFANSSPRGIDVTYFLFPFPFVVVGKQVPTVSHVFGHLLNKGIDNLAPETVFKEVCIANSLWKHENASFQGNVGMDLLSALYK